MIILLLASDARSAMATADRYRESGHTVLGPAECCEAAVRLAAEAKPDYAVIELARAVADDGQAVVENLKGRLGVPCFFVR